MEIQIIGPDENLDRRDWRYEFWPVLADASFRYVQWCIVIGVIRFASESAESTLLSFVAGALYLTLIMRLYVFYSERIRFEMGEIEVLGISLTRMVQLLVGTAFITVFAWIGFFLVPGVIEALIFA